MSHRFARSCGSPPGDPAALGGVEAGGVDAWLLGGALGTGEVIVPRPTDGDGEATGAVVAADEVQATASVATNASRVSLVKPWVRAACRLDIVRPPEDLS